MAECVVLEAFAKDLEAVFFPGQPTRMPGQVDSSERAVETLSEATQRIFAELQNSRMEESAKCCIPSSFEVLLVVDRDDQSWCLVRCDRLIRDEFSR